jgi:malate dehydrogenase
MKKSVKLAITGAGGDIAYALLFRIAAGEMFGKDTNIELNLIEVPAALNALDGVCMELQDCAFPLLKSINVTADYHEGMRDVDWALLLGAAPRSKDMLRRDLLKINASIFKEQGNAINDNASVDVKVLVVGNPCNTNCLVAMHNAPNIPSQNFYAMTMLDEKRAITQLAAKAGVSVNGVKNMIVWGNHSLTQFPDFYHASIDEHLVLGVIDDLNWLQNDFLTTIQERGSAVIKTRGSSSAASAANAIIETVHKIIQPTSANELFSLACRFCARQFKTTRLLRKA